MEKLLASSHVSVVWAGDLGSALGQLRRQQMPVLLDLSRGAAALQIARELRTQRPGVLLFAVADEGRPDLTTEAVITGVADVFPRPPSVRHLTTAIERQISARSRQSSCSEEVLGPVLYSLSPSMREVASLVSRATSTRAGVIIRGEGGTGRQVVARAIHTAQPGAAAFVSVDCAAYDEDQLESALFGNAARTYSAPTTDDDRPEGPGGNEASDPGTCALEYVSRDSRLHEARGGTLYLKHVTEAPTRVQVRLWRALRDREVVLVETRKTIALDVRPMAGVDPGIDHAVEEGCIREALFNRLSVIRIEMPPLRNRRDDIPALVNYFLREICFAQSVQPKTLSRPALSLIAALPWRGNGIELRSMLESIVVGLSDATQIGLEDVLAHVRLDAGPVVFTNGGTLRQARALFEREYIASVLDQHHGRISRAAKALGIQRTNLYRKMRSLRVVRDKHL